ncbi:hypothetical protein BJV74DRAFT_883157 [Russula compacta]|nr:hypothetical protein BJV74DRAFT_883157 [Russula compacta]
MSSLVQLDPYTAQAQNDNVTLLQKIQDLHKIIQAAQTGMLTTRASDGYFHARAMTPVGRQFQYVFNLSPSRDHGYSCTAYSNTQVNLVFIANNTSPKFQEIQNDNHVNVSFFDTATTHWASFSGIARVIEDTSVIKKYWSSSIAAYFGDLGDGIHKGDENDPRVAAIEVVPDEVRYWLATSGSISRGVQEIASAAQGKVTVPGELRTITKEEVRLTQGTGAKSK